LVLLWVVAAAAALPIAAQAFDQRLGIGVGGDYSQLFRRQATDPLSAYGGGANVYIQYGFTDAFGASVAAGMAWFGGYVPIVPVAAIDENGEQVTVFQRGPQVDDIQLWDLALSLIYAIDVTRVVPYFALGVVSARIAETHAGQSVVDYEIGMRTDLGFDYKLLRHLTLGAAAGMDTYFTDSSGYSSRFEFIVRVTVIWDLCELGPRAVSD
jgi:hypothetical protein